MTTSPPEDDSEYEDMREHLAEVEDGCGCTELWEYLSERRDVEE